MKVRKNIRITDRMNNDVQSFAVRFGISESYLIELAWWLARDELEKRLKSGGRNQVLASNVKEDDNDPFRKILLDKRFDYLWNPV